MGKRIELDFVYRPGARAARKPLVAPATNPKAPGAAKVRKGQAKPRTVKVVWKGADTPVTLKGTDAYGKPVEEHLVVPKATADAMRQVLNREENPAAVLARKREVKAAQQRRFRAKRKAKASE